METTIMGLHRVWGLGITVETIPSANPFKQRGAGAFAIGV